MIYANMAKFQIASVEQVVKVGDTVADIQEGKHRGGPLPGGAGGQQRYGIHPGGV